MVIEQANSRKPQDILIQAADTEANILRKEAAKKRRLMPIRTLMQKIPNLLVKLKPCLLMSPISVSQNTDIKGQRYLTDNTRNAYDNRKRAQEFLDKLKQYGTKRSN